MLTQINNPYTDADASIQPDALSEITLKITVPDMAREGVIDVLSMRSLVRACRHVFMRHRQDEFDRALAKMINLNGAMAQAIERDDVGRE